MLTAEDDVTAILRFTRGTVLNPCGGAVAAAACKSHLTVRAATFCIAHVLNAADLWRVVLKYSAHQNHGKPINSAFQVRYQVTHSLLSSTSIFESNFVCLLRFYF